MTYVELCVYFLVSTKKYYPEAIIDILWVDREQFCRVVQSLESKMAKGKYGLPKGYKVTQPLMYEYCKLDLK